MGVFDFFKKGADSETKIEEPKSEVITGNGGVFYGGGYQPIVSKVWDGEKTGGELGAVVKNVPDFYRLRLRALDAYTKTDIVKIIVDRKLQWIIGTGLKFEAEPNKTILEMEGIILPDDFYKITEARFKTFFGSVHCDFSKQQGLTGLAWDCKQGTYLGGDTLVVVRIENGYPTIQLISGEFVRTPINNLTSILDNGNYIECGVEYNDRGEHVAYHVKVLDANDKSNLLGKYERIPAYGEKTGLRMAWLVYGEKLSQDHKRGVPEISQILEKVNKLDRYTEAAVSKAEQAANLVYSIEHDAQYGTGENPLADMVAKKFTKKLDDGTEKDGFALADGIANRVAQTTSGIALNLPPGAKLHDFNTNIETNYEQFFEANFKNACASMGIPYEVALQSYNSNYSASRAAINGFGYIIDIDIDDIATQFYKPIYRIFLYTEILRNKIEAPGYIKAINTNDFMVVEAYSNCRFVGRKMPHIDPLKEVKAVREALGDKLTGTPPLISLEQAAEMLNYGNWQENYEESQEEQTIINQKNVKDATIVTVDNSGTGVGSQTQV